MTFKKYKYEHELCDDFLINLSDDWDVYPEFGSWDILIVHKINGTQIGIQAKNRLDWYVITQALQCTVNHYYKDIKTFGPDYRAILVPEIVEGFRLICDMCKVLYLIPQTKIDNIIVTNEDFKLNHEKRYHLPEIKLNTKCGISSPRALSTWRISALKVMLLYEKQGYVTSKDIIACDISNPSLIIQKYFKYCYREPKIGRCYKLKLKNENNTLATGYEKELEDLRNVLNKE